MNLETKYIFELYKKRQYKKTIKECKAFLRNIEDENVYNILGISLAITGEISKSIDAYKSAISSYPNSEAIKQNLAKIYFDNKKYFEAKELYKQLYEKTKKHDYKLKIADSYISQGFYKKGETHLLEVFQDNKGDIIMLDKIAQLFIKTKKFSEAIKYLKKAQKIDPENVGILNNLAIANKFIGNNNEAIKIFKKLLKNDKTSKSHFHIYNNLGILNLEENNFENALAFFNKSLAIKPNDQSTNYNLGNLYRKINKYSEALKHYKKSGNIGEVICLEMLFEEDKINDFQNQIIKFNKNEPFNNRVAAISSYASEQWGVKNNYDFCKIPISYLDHVNLSSELEDNNFSYKELINECQNLVEVWEPDDSTTTNGTQTFGNLFNLESKNIDILKKIIYKNIEAHKIRYKNENDLYIKKWPINRFLNGWIVNLKSGGFQDSHIHQNAWLSGVFYINVPKSKNKDGGSIKFTSKGFDYSMKKNETIEKIINPAKGDLVLFPSSLFHQTIPFNSDDERICLAFDMMPIF